MRCGCWAIVAASRLYMKRERWYRLDVDTHQYFFSAVLADSVRIAWSVLSKSTDDWTSYMPIDEEERGRRRGKCVERVTSEKGPGIVAEESRATVKSVSEMMNGSRNKFRSHRPSVRPIRNRQRFESSSSSLQREHTDVSFLGGRWNFIDLWSCMSIETSTRRETSLRIHSGRTRGRISVSKRTSFSDEHTIGRLISMMIFHHPVRSRYWRRSSFLCRLTYIVCATILMIGAFVIYCCIRRKRSSMGIASCMEPGVFKMANDEIMRLTVLRNALEASKFTQWSRLAS